MDRTKPGTWFELAAALGALAAIALVLSDRFVEHAASRPLFWSCIGLATLGLIAAIVGFLLLVRKPRVKYEPRTKDKGSALSLSLSRSDGGRIGYARCVLTKRGHDGRQGDPLRHGEGRVVYEYPLDFEKSRDDGVLPAGRYGVEWSVLPADVSLRGVIAGDAEWRRAARGRVRITDTHRAAAERLLNRGLYRPSHETGQNGRVQLRITRYEEPLGWLEAAVLPRGSDASTRPYVGHLLEGSESTTEAALVFPDDFRREIGQTRRLVDGMTEIERHYDHPTGASGDYDVTWRRVWYVSGGTFAVDHEIEFDDFRREEEVATDSFTISPSVQQESRS